MNISGQLLIDIDLNEPTTTTSDFHKFTDHLQTAERDPYNSLVFCAVFPCGIASLEQGIESLYDPKEIRCKRRATPCYNLERG